mgnify:FL=1
MILKKQTKPINYKARKGNIGKVVEVWPIGGYDVEFKRGFTEYCMEEELSPYPTRKAKKPAKPKKEKLEKQINFEPGYDYIYGIPKKDPRYGRHGMSIRFVLKGTRGAVQFLMFTNWLPMVKKDEWSYEPTYKGMGDVANLFPMAADIGYHSPRRMWKGQMPMKGKCEYVIGGICYYDGSGLDAEEYMVTLINEGEEALWKKMEKCYRETLDDTKK